MAAIMKLTDTQRKAVKFDGNVLVEACPGSGKTRTLVAKMLHCLEDVRGSTRRLACITYTNAAVYEIEHRLHSYGAIGDDDYCEVSTIHSFCLNNILRHFYWRLPAYKEGFSVLPSDSDLYKEIALSVCKRHSLTPKERVNALDSFALLNRDPDGSPIVSYPLTTDIAYDFWETLESQGLIDFTNIVYLSYQLLVKFPSITNAISSKFAWFLVDEFQDTSALQVEILKLLAVQKQSKFFLVGDPNQSIYGFAGAKPTLMNEFATYIHAESGFKLLSNFRSQQSIINFAERLCPRTPPMLSSANEEKVHSPEYIHSQTAFSGIVDHFLPLLEKHDVAFGNAAILAPWWIKLLHLGRNLRESGIPIVGPGARPYKRSHLFAVLSENICAYIDKSDPQQIPKIEKELFSLITNATGNANFDIYSYRGRMAVFGLVDAGISLHNQYQNGCQWLCSAAETFSSLLCDQGFLPLSCANLLSESVNDMIADMMKNGVDVETLTTEDLGMFASSEKNLKLLTMHKAKGREFDAVAVIDLHDGRVPHFAVRTDDEIEEARRLLYVATTRARHLLMYITDDEDRRISPSRFLFQSPNCLGFLD